MKNTKKHELEVTGGVLLIVGSSLSLWNVISNVRDSDIEFSSSIFESYQNLGAVLKLIEVGHIVTFILCLAILILSIIIAKDENKSNIKLIISALIISIIALNPLATIGGIFALVAQTLYKNNNDHEELDNG